MSQAICICLYRSLFRLYLKQLNKKWKIKNGQCATLRFFNFIYVIRKRIVCTRLYLFYFRLYLKGFEDTTRFSFCATVGPISISLKMTNFPSWRIFEILKSLYLRTLWGTNGYKWFSFECRLFHFDILKIG